MKSIALFVAIYGRTALADLSDSCEAGDSGTSCNACTPLNSEFEPPGVGQVWYSHCCTISDTNTADPPETTSKKYCHSYYLTGYPNNQFAGTKPTCSEKGSGNLAWLRYGQCKTTGGTAPYVVQTAISTGCPGQYDSSTVYESGDTVEDNEVVYTCSGAAAFCNLYEPNLKGIGETYWTPTNSCTGTGTPTESPVFTSPQDGCPEEFDSGTTYEANDKVTVTRADDSKVVYACKAFPASQWCNVATYSPLNTDKQCNGDVCWPQAWTRIGGCLGSYSPTGTPTFDPANVEGCPEAYSSGTEYEAGDKVSAMAAGEDYGKIYECKAWPDSNYCGQEAFSPLNSARLCNDKVCWPTAWTYLGGCTGTITPTATPTFDPANVGGCPEAFEEGTDYEEGDKMSIVADGEDYGKIYKCKGWPYTDHCKNEAFSPLNTAKACAGEVCWPVAWTYEGGCTGTITPTAAPQFTALSKWVKEGCPPEYVPNNSAYKPEDYVSVPKNEDNTYGVVWQCKNAMTAPWCQNEGYAPGTQHGGQAWEKVGYCDGTISPTVSPTPFTGPCQFKYKLETTDGGEYVILQAGSWQKGGTTIATGGTALDLYKPGNLVRNGDDARKCNNYPYSFYCDAWSPFVNDDSSVYNPTLSRQGWAKATCENVASKLDASDGSEDEFSGSNKGPVFASNGNVLVDASGACQTGESTAAPSDANNPGDYFKPSPTVKGCQKCDAGKGLGSTDTPKVCTACLAGTTGKIVDGKSQCVCDNGATDPWDAGGSHCQACPAGGRYLGPVDNALGVGVCEDACPTAHPVYTSKTSTGTFKLCCKAAHCTTDGGIADCFDGTSGKTFCNAAGATAHPTTVPSAAPSGVPSDVPSDVPSGEPSDVPSGVPSGEPSDVPSGVPSGEPSDVPSGVPSGEPSDVPSGVPSEVPSEVPSGVPSDVPSGEPSVSSEPSVTPPSS